MALKIQYNKTFIQLLKRQLSIRLNALPTLQAKESALRVEVKKAKSEVADIEQRLSEQTREVARTYKLWVEFPEGIVSVKNVDLDVRKIAGVKTPVLREVDLEIAAFSLFGSPAWIATGLTLLREITRLHIAREVARKKLAILEFARKKTTQKVNLYEKVQIPEYEESIRKIKRFLEDEENLAKSSQKILKTRMARAEGVAV